MPAAATTDAQNHSYDIQTLSHTAALPFFISMHDLMVNDTYKFRRIKFPAEISPSDDSTCFYRGGSPVLHYSLSKNFFIQQLFFDDNLYSAAQLQNQDLIRRRHIMTSRSCRRIQSPFIRLKPAVMDAVILSIGISGPCKEKNRRSLCE